MESIAPGIHSLDFETYQRAAGISNSMLTWLAAPYTPAHFRARWIDNIVPHEETDAMRFGQLVHRILLEPDTIEGAFYVKPPGTNYSTTKGREWRDEHSDRPIITAEQASAVKGMRESVLHHPVARRMIEHSQKEQNVFAEDSTGVLRKARLDLLPKNGNTLADLKTCESAHPDFFCKNVGNYGYHRQAAFYLDICNLIGREFQKWLFICVEKTPPYAVAVHPLDDIAVEYGRRLYQRDLQLYRNCMETGEWPGFGHGLGYVGLPPHMQREAENFA